MLALISARRVSFSSLIKPIARPPLMPNRRPRSRPSHQCQGKPITTTTDHVGTVSNALGGLTVRDASPTPSTAGVGVARLPKGPVGADFVVDGNTYCRAQIRATFYPKFENEKSDQEVRTRMIEMVSAGQAVLEVSLKHSGSLFMYAGHEGGAYAKNSYGNIYTAVGVFVLGRTLREAWGAEVSRKQEELNDYLEEVASTNKSCLVVLYKPYLAGLRVSPPGQIVLKSVTAFFAAYDALCEEGTATPVCRALDEVADISVPGSKDHVKVQGEILEGLVARIVNRESSKHMEKVLNEFQPPPLDGGGQDLGHSLRDLCAANRSDEKQEMIRLMRQRRLPAAFKCYCNFHKLDSITGNNLYFRMVIHVHSDSAFRRYQKEMRENRGLWPLYRGFFLDINMFKVSKERAAELVKDSYSLLADPSASSDKSTIGTDVTDIFDSQWFVNTFQRRPWQMKIWGTSAGKQRELSKMLDEWAVYIRTKCGKKPLSSSIYLSEAEPFLERYAKRSRENQVLVGSAGNLVMAEEFLAIVEGCMDEEGDLDREEELPSSYDNVARDSVPKAEGLIVFFPGMPGCAKSALCKEILSTPGGLGDDRPVYSLMGDLIKGRYWQKIADERRKKPYAITLADKNAPNEEVWKQIEDMCLTTRASAVPVIPDSEGTDSNPFSLDALAVFIFRVIQRVNHPGSLDKSSPNAGYVLLMFYNLYEGKNRREFESELLERFGALIKMPLLKSDRNPLPDPVKAILEEGRNLYKLHTNRHGRSEPSKGTYAREWAQWEKRLREIIFANAEYLNSIQLQESRTLGARIERLIQELEIPITPGNEKPDLTTHGNSKSNSIQALVEDPVPFDFAVKDVQEQLRKVAKGEYTIPSTEKRKFGNITFAAISLPIVGIKNLLKELAEKIPGARDFLKDKDMESKLNRAHITLAHKRAHGVTAVASYGVFAQQNVPVHLTALLFSDKLAAFEAKLGAINDEKISSKNQWPHVTIWTGEGASAKEANMLPQLLSEGKATRIEIDPPVTISGTLDFY
ncbi:hypothetical protein QJS10_CPA07g01100 [Acorus calamus]|uniref:tRNA ligase phosphodiesterase domain-containing protein n=1 Tax=Acorus calamus TaxID=4465 RepID=A0AAV9EHL2_ACOCL|nr:hypothetical protein QJS10_CPA07g01100 [Acorus calamus]